MNQLKNIVLLGVAVCALNTWAMVRGEEVDPEGVPAATAGAMADPAAEDVPADQGSFAQTCRQAESAVKSFQECIVRASLRWSTQLDPNARLFANKMIACPEGIASDVRQIVSHKPAMKDYGVEQLMDMMDSDGSLILKNNHPLMAAIRQQAGISQLSLVETVAVALTHAGHDLSSFDKAILQHKFAPYTILQREGAAAFALERFNAAAFDKLKATYYDVPA